MSLVKIRSILNYILYVIIVSIPLAGVLLINVGHKIDFTFSLRHIYLLGNSLRLFFIVSILVIFFGFICALFIYNSRKLIGLIKYYFILAIPIPFFVYALAWMYLIKLLSLILPNLLTFTLKGIQPCIFVETLTFLPLSIMIILKGIRDININQLRMGTIYKNDILVVFQIVIHYIYPHILIIVSLIAILCLTDFSVPSMFQYNTYALDIFSVYSRTGSAITAYYECLPLVFLLIYPLFLFIKNVKYICCTNCSTNFYSFKFGTFVNLVVFIVFIMSILQILVPMISFFVVSGNLLNIIENGKLIIDALATTMKMSFFSALICDTLATLPIVFLMNNKKSIFLLFALYPIVIPGSIQAMGILKVVNFIGFIELQRSVLLTSIGCALKYVPLTVVIYYIFMSKRNNNELNIAKVMCVSKIRYLKIVFLENFSQYILGFVFTFLLSFAEEGISLILMAPGKETLTVKIYNYLHYGASNYVSSFVLISIILLLLVETCLYITLHKFLKI